MICRNIEIKKKQVFFMGLNEFDSHSLFLNDGRQPNAPVPFVTIEVLDDCKYPSAPGSGDERRILAEDSLVKAFHLAEGPAS